MPVKPLDFSKLKYDVPASLVVFLVALPLCLGIAVASGTPPITGLIAGIIGGIIVGFFSQSHTSVSGPAAGLTAVVISAVETLGSLELFFAAVALAGVLQFIIGLLKAGIIAEYIPSNVIKGLLAAIGIILIFKQIPHALGVDKDPEGDFSFFQIDGENTLTEFFHAFESVRPGAVLICLISLAILILWKKIKANWAKYLPGTLVVVVAGVAINQFFKGALPGLYIEASHLVNIPKVNLDSGMLHFPALSLFLQWKIWVVAFTIAAVASLETLLNIEAVDNLDPQKRNTPPNRELLAQGAGNLVSGLLGGLPVTSVIVRSSVNLDAGAQTKMSAILHGILMFIAVLLFAPLMNNIPLAALAAILLLTGYKLASINQFKAMYKKGWNQFFPFIVTVLAIYFTDLLIGILIGLSVSAFFILRNSFNNPFAVDTAKLHIGEVLRIELPNQVTFLNKATIKTTLWEIPADSKVIIDASRAQYIDHDVVELIRQFADTVAPEQNIQLKIVGLQEEYFEKDYLQFSNVLDKETQQKLKPLEILALLKDGNKRFVEGRSQQSDYIEQASATSSGQSPMAVIVNCVDSRTSPEIVMDAGLGELITIRVAGNIISPEIIGSIEIGIAKLGAKLILVKGHSQCGAVGVAINRSNSGFIDTITNKIEKAIQDSGYERNSIDVNNDTQMEKIICLNVRNSIREILDQSQLLRDKVNSGEIAIVGAYHDLHTRVIHFEEPYEPNRR
jgi:carbonic anhydrase